MQNLTLRQLRSLRIIQSTGKISAAAKSLGLTAPAVTLQLQQLEIEVGMPLFDRTPDGMRPTAAGLAVLEAARGIEERLRLLGEEIEALASGKGGSLKLGVVSTAKYFAPRLLAAFLKQHPGIQVDLLVGNRAEIIAALKRHELDTVLMGRPPREVAVRSQMFGDHPFVIIAPADHPLAAKRRIAKATIAKERFLIREPGSGTRMSLEVFFADVPEKLEDLGTEMGSNETIKQAVMAGLGIAFISAHTIEQELQLGRLAVLDVAGMPITKQWYGVSRLDRSMSPAMQAFSAFLEAHGAASLPAVGNAVPTEPGKSF
jgi:LysR family transcriptional regulator, low CO2-responsive transcriptional regulator